MGETLGPESEDEPEGFDARELETEIYADLRALAAAHLRREPRGHTLDTVALLHEAWLRFSADRALGGCNREQYFALAARTIRRVLVDHARARGAQKRGGDRGRAALRADLPAEGGLDVDLLDLDATLERLAGLHPRQARVVELRFFGGLGVEEAALALGVSPRTVEGDWAVARAWLRRELDQGAAP